jgi:hypothetical protein
MWADEYVGESEKNIDALLAHADDVDTDLLFDDADTLFDADPDFE